MKRKPPKPKTPKSPKTDKPALAAEEWAFHRVPVREWDAATNYEYQRDAAAMLKPKATPKELKQFWAFWLAGNGLPESTNPQQQKPWPALPARLRAALVARCGEWQRHKSDGALEPLTEVRPAALGTPDSNFAERVVFDVDWGAKDKALVRKFAEWLEQGRKEKRGFLSELRPQNKTGPKTFAPALCDLVIWRARRAGLTMKATYELTHPFLQSAGGVGKVINPIQRARACQSAQKKVEGRAAGGVRMFNALPAYRPVEDWIALAAGRKVPVIMDRMSAKAAALNKVSKRNRGK